MPPKARGTYAIKSQRARKRVSSETRSYIIPLVGPYALLEANEPAIDSNFSGYPAEYKVSDVSLEDLGGGAGRMTVTIEAPRPGTPAGESDEQLAEPIYESDYAEERRPTEEHKKCGKLKADRPYYEYPDRKKSTANPAKTASQADADPEIVYKQRTWDNWQSLDADDFVQASGGWTLTQYKALKEKGRNDYPVNYPICSMTSYHRARPASGSAVNSVSAPPSQCSPPSGFTYVKTTDRVTKQGRLFTRVQAWRGYDSTDDLFYL